jgi:acyl transferase domain-containing protein
MGVALDAMVPIPVDRWDNDWLLVPGVDANTAGLAGRFGGFLADWASFDAALFAVSPSEAALMDPQQRVLLEVRWRQGWLLIDRSVTRGDPAIQHC